MLDLFKRKLFKIIFWMFVLFALPFSVLMLVGSQRYIYRAEIRIDAAIEVIFPYLHEPERVIQWQASVKSITPMDPEFNLPGHTALMVLQSEGSEHTVPITIEDIFPSTQLITSSETNVFKTQTTWELKPHGNQTIIRQEVVCFYSGIGRLMAPFLSDEAERQLREDLEILKATVEKVHAKS